MRTNQSDLIGKTFGRLTAVRFDKVVNRRAHWICECKCGVIKSVARSNLTGGQSKSCGFCASATHGHSRNGKHTPTMRSWSNMIARCTNPSTPSFSHYKARGIDICARWREGEGGLSGFYCFLKDMGEKPTFSDTIERVDNDRGYSPDNCVWASKKAQGRNRTTTHFFHYRDKNMTLEELAKETGLSFEALRWRLIRKKMPLEEALSLPVQKGTRFSRSVPLILVNFNGERLTLRQVSEKSGVSLSTIKARHKAGRQLT